MEIFNEEVKNTAESSWDKRELGRQAPAGKHTTQQVASESASSQSQGGQKLSHSPALTIGTERQLLSHRVTCTTA